MSVFLTGIDYVLNKKKLNSHLVKITHLIYIKLSWMFYFLIYALHVVYQSLTFPGLVFRGFNVIVKYVCTL